jgi:hypothetical protein
MFPAAAGWVDHTCGFGELANAVACWHGRLVAQCRAVTGQVRIVVKHSTASAFLFGLVDGGWRLGMIEHPRPGMVMIAGGHVEGDETAAQAECANAGGDRVQGAVDRTVRGGCAAGYPHPVMPQPWWITELQVPRDNHLGEDHVFVAVADAMEPSEADRPPGQTGPTTRR